MKIKITRHVQKGNDYAHYPGQVLIDHPDEKSLIDQGHALAIPEERESAKLAKAETRKAK